MKKIPYNIETEFPFSFQDMIDYTYKHGNMQRVFTKLLVHTEVNANKNKNCWVIIGRLVDSLDEGSVVCRRTVIKAVNSFAM